MTTPFPPCGRNRLQLIVLVSLAAPGWLGSAWVRADSGPAMAPTGRAGLVDCDTRQTLANALQRANPEV